jgi:small subunit ribosomal protein S6
LKRYEGMFLFDSAGARDWAAIDQEVRRLLGRISAEPLVCIKFDERKLAYEIKRRKRGTYVLTYFNAPPERITELERDVQLSESVLRVLVVRAEHVTDERIRELQAWPAENPLQPLGEGRRHDDDRGRGGRDWERRGPRDREPLAEVPELEAPEGADLDLAQ